MAHRRIRFALLAATALSLASASVLSAQGRLERRVLPQGGRLFVAGADTFLGAGAVFEARGGPPWASEELGASEGGRMLRRFGKTLYVMNAAAGTISRVREDGTALPTLDFGSGGMPQDIYVHPSGAAYVTRLDAFQLLRVDLATTSTRVVADFSVFAEPGETIQARTMIADGDRLLIQLAFLGRKGESRGALAVLDMASETFVDADPIAPGLQPIALQGAPPHLKMQRRGRSLFVSTTLFRFDSTGGIERVDLDGLASTGFVLTEAQAFGADLGGFVMTGDGAGYCVFHTDIVPSTHLRSFTIAGGLDPGGDLATLLGDVVDSLVFDARRRRVYLPSGFSFASSPGIFVLDAETNRVLPATPVSVGVRVHDIELAR